MLSFVYHYIICLHKGAPLQSEINCFVASMWSTWTALPPSDWHWKGNGLLWTALSRLLDPSAPVQSWAGADTGANCSPLNATEMDPPKEEFLQHWWTPTMPTTTKSHEAEVQLYHSYGLYQLDDVCSVHCWKPIDHPVSNLMQIALQIWFIFCFDRTADFSA